MQKTWKIKEPAIELKDALARDLGVSSLFAQLLVNRGIEDAQTAAAFLRSDLSDLADPFLMKGMGVAVDRLRRAVRQGEPIFIATDFDVDGVTSCAVLEDALRRAGGRVSHYVPHRLKDGYGVNAEAVRLARENRAAVFVSLDCGVTAVDEVAALNEAGIDVLVIDHHEPPPTLPAALAILDPKQKDCPYPFKELAGVGLAYKVVQALETPDAQEYLDLVALGTVADVVPLRGENRIFVRHGLDALNRTRRHGLRSLMEASGIKKEKKISTHSISFILAPRLNASGRMDTAHASLDLLLSDDAGAAGLLAEGLNEHNRRRQRIEEKVLTEAIEMIDRQVDFRDDFVIVLSKEDWHPGVLGIVASKIVDRYYRPAVIISLQDEVGRGSARSVPHFHIYEALAQCDSFLKGYGGHQHAAGLTIDRKDIGAFKALLNTVARACFEREMLAPSLEIDAEIPLAILNEELLGAIDRLSPYGEGNRRPVFATRHLEVRSKPALMGRNTIKFWASDGEWTYEAIGFGLSEAAGLVAPGRFVDLAYCLSRDEWDPHQRVLLEVKDIKPSS